jgi:Zn-dependent protease
MHGRVAFALGDNTARDKGRLSLNPIKHLDPWGTVALLVFGFGWAKPVPVNPYMFKNPKRDMVLVSVAGPLANFVTAILVAKLFLAGAVFNTPLLGSLIDQIVFINVALGVFNLLPIPPLDGSKIVPALLPDSMQQAWWKFEQYGFVILLLLMFALPGGLSFIRIPINLLLPLVYSPIPVSGMF